MTAVAKPSAGVISGELLQYAAAPPSVPRPADHPQSFSSALRRVHESVAQGGVVYQYGLLNVTTGLPHDCPAIDHYYYCYDAEKLRRAHAQVASIEKAIGRSQSTAVLAIVHSEQTRYRYGAYDRSSYLIYMQQIFDTCALT